MFNILIGVVMVAAFVGMIVCSKKQHDVPAAKPAAVGLLSTVVVCAILMLNYNLGGGKGKEEVKVEQQYIASSTYVLGKHLASVMPGVKALVVTDNANEESSFQKAKIDALKKGLDPAITNLVFDTPPKKDVSSNGPSSGPMSALSAADLDRVFAKHRDCKLIILLIGLPFNSEQMKIWDNYKRNKDKTPRLALASGEVSAVGAYIQSGLVVGAVAFNPKYRYDKNAPKPTSFEEAFKERYLLLTPKNVIEMSKKYPMLFPRRRH